MQASSPAAAAAQMELGFHTSYQTVPVPGRTDLFQVRVFTTPRTGGEELTTADVARRLGLSTAHTNRLLRGNKIKSHVPGLRHRRIYQRDLDDYMRSRGMAG